jgi:hypothetical protein
MLHLEQGLAHKRSQGSNEAVITEEKGKRKAETKSLFGNHTEAASIQGKNPVSE